MKKVLSVVLIALNFGVWADQLPSWTADALKNWGRHIHQVSSAQVTNGVLKVVCGGFDAHIYSSACDLPATATHEVVIRARTSCGGVGELFWMEPGKGATQNLSCSFMWIGDSAWHEYRVRPFWQGISRVGGLRIDFPSSSAEGGVFEIERIAVENMKEDVISFPAENAVGVTFSLAAQEAGMGTLEWVSGEVGGLQKETFRIPGDGRRHRYFFPLQDKVAWKGNIVLMKVVPPKGTPGATDLKFVAEEPALPPDLVLKGARVADAFNRVGSEIPIVLTVDNLGTCPAKDVRIDWDPLPPGVQVVGPRQLVGIAHECEATSFTVRFICAEPRSFTARFKISASGVETLHAEVPVQVLPSLNLPKAAYVPEPKPVKTDYDLSALYFPGWVQARAWERVWKVCPERKPVLGWYDEANPECVDWQIKWLVESGIRTLFVDWYWSRGSQHLDHWVKAFYRAKYRHYMKWAMMWANHNEPGSHSEADQRAVTRFWIDHYFSTPEYLKIDGKPVVWIWSPQNMEADMAKKGGCSRLLEISRQVAQEAGFKGIHFIAMKWAEADCSAKTILRYKNMGFDETSIYRFMSHDGKCTNDRRYPFSAVADANPDNWWRQHEANVLPFLPNITTGWDDRPWNDSIEIYGKNVDDFRRICQKAREFGEKTGNKRFCLGPLNEWGEGSYAEPNAEFGFGFYNAVRETFCTKPEEGWPLNFGPKDVGLGPYDLPPPARPEVRTEWTFTDGKVQNWHAMMGLDVQELKATGEGLSFGTSSCDSAISCSLVPFNAAQYKAFVVRMKVEGAGKFAQLFWANPSGHAHESASVCVDLVCDGAYHDYVFDVQRNREWRGRVSFLRFDPVSASGVKVGIQSMKFIPREKSGK